MDYHEAAYILSAPFTGGPRELVKTPERIYNVTDVTNGSFFVTEGSRAKHRQKIRGGVETVVRQLHRFDIGGQPIELALRL